MPTRSEDKVRRAIKEVRAYYAVGRRAIKALCDDRGQLVGDLVEYAKKELGWNNGTTLFKAIQFARQSDGYTPDDLERLCADMAKHGRALTVSHVGHLVTITGPERGRLQEACIAGGWSVRRLVLEMRGRLGKRKDGGRKRHVSTEAAGALAQAYAMANTWLRWAGPARANGVLGKLPPEEAAAIETVTAAMEKLRAAAKASAESRKAGG